MYAWYNAVAVSGWVFCCCWMFLSPATLCAKQLLEYCRAKPRGLEINTVRTTCSPYVFHTSLLRFLSPAILRFSHFPPSFPEPCHFFLHDATPFCRVAENVRGTFRGKQNALHRGRCILNPGPDSLHGFRGILVRCLARERCGFARVRLLLKPSIFSLSLAHI